MKNLFVLSLLLVLTFASTSSFAQKWKDPSYGIYFSAGGSVSAGDVEKGSKTAPMFAWNFGSIGFAPVSKDVAVGLAVALDARGMNFHDESTDTRGTDYHIYSIFFTPQVRISGFTLGLGIGKPVAVTASSTDDKPVNDLGVTLGDDLNMQVELRIGGDILLTQSRAGNELRLMAFAGYPLTQLATQGFWIDGSHSNADGPIVSSHNNGPVATVQLGLSYRFDWNVIHGVNSGSPID